MRKKYSRATEDRSRADLAQSIAELARHPPPIQAVLTHGDC